MHKLKKLLKNKMFLISLAVILLIAAIAAPFVKITVKDKHEKLPYSDFITKVEDGKIESALIASDGEKILVTLKDGKQFAVDNPRSPDFQEFLLKNDVEVETEKASILIGVLISLVQMGFMMWLMYFFIQRIYKSVSSPNTNANVNVTEEVEVTFADIAGNEEAKEDMMELVDFLKNPVKYERYGATPPRGTLLYGPPGTGKTLLAKALAGEANVPCIALSGSSFVEKFVGVGAGRVRHLFEQARKMKPCIVFIDEIDALGKRQSGSGAPANDERDQTLNQLLVEMDGFSQNEGILVIAATNRLDMLDKALLRSGRFDRQIYVGLPDVNARYEILKLHSASRPLNPEVDLMTVAKMTTYMSGADLANVLNEASIYAARANHSGILMEDIDRAINKILVGEERKNRKNITQKDKMVSAYHEAGHALIAKLLANKTIPKVTIIPTTKGAGGYTLINPEEKMFETKKDLYQEIAISLGGRAAEEIIFGEDNITGGASQDLRTATKTAVRMVKNYGMSKTIGLVNIQELYENSWAGTTSETIAQEVRQMIEETYKETIALLLKHKDILIKIAQALLDKETLYEVELNDLVFGQKPITLIKPVSETKTEKQLVPENKISSLIPTAELA